MPSGSDEFKRRVGRSLSTLQFTVMRSSHAERDTENSCLRRSVAQTDCTPDQGPLLSADFVVGRPDVFLQAYGDPRTSISTVPGLFAGGDAKRLRKLIW